MYSPEPVIRLEVPVTTYLFRKVLHMMLRLICPPPELVGGERVADVP